MLSVTELVGFGVGGAGPVTSISTFSQTSGTTGGTFSYPAGLQAGDFIIFFEDSRNTSGNLTDVDMTGSGWNTPIYNRSDATTGTAERLKTSTRICTGAESGSFSCLSGTSYNTKIMLVIRGNNPIVSSVASSVTDQITTANPTPQIVAAAGQPAPLVCASQMTANAAISPRSVDPNTDVEEQSSISGSRNSWLVWKYYNSTPEDVEFDMDDEGANFLQSYYIRFA